MPHEQQKVVVVLDFLAHEQETLDRLRVATERAVRNAIYDLNLGEGVNVSSVLFGQSQAVAGSGIGAQV